MDKTYITGRAGGAWIIVLVGALAYSNTFGVPFAFDDYNNIVLPAQRWKLSNLLWQDALPLIIRLRLLGYLTFKLNYQVHGLAVAGYHAVNLLIHISAALCLYSLVRLTFRTPFFKGSAIREHSNAIALLSALLFVTHPLQTQAVTYIVQRFTSLAALLYLSALILYIKARLLPPGLRSRAFLIASMLATLLSMMTKESAFTIPVTIAMYEMFFISGVPGRWRSLAAVSTLLLFIPAQFVASSLQTGEHYLSNLEASTSYVHDISRSTYMITQLRVLVTYIRMVFLPYGQNLDHDYPVYDSLLSYPVMLSALFLILICAMGFWLFRRSAMGEPALRMTSFGIAWFFVTLSVESSFFPLDIIFEHRMYLPVAGVLIALVTALSLAVRKISARPAGLMTVLSTALVLIMTMATYSRNEVWRDNITLWQDVVRKSPGKVRPNFNLAVWYTNAGRTEEAIGQFEKTLSLDPLDVPSLKTLGYLYQKKGRIQEAIDMYRRVLEIKPGEHEVMSWLAVSYYLTGQTELSVRYLNDSAEHVQNSEILNNAGVIYHLAHEFKRAEAILLRCTGMFPLNAQCHFNMGLVYFENNFPEKARGPFQEALKLNPQDTEARDYLQRINSTNN